MSSAASRFNAARFASITPHATSSATDAYPWMSDDRPGEGRADQKDLEGLLNYFRVGP